MRPRASLFQVSQSHKQTNGKGYLNNGQVLRKVYPYKEHQTHREGADIGYSNA